MRRPDTALLAGLQHKDPKLYQFLRDIASATIEIQNNLDPLVIAAAAVAAATAAVGDVTGFIHTFQLNGVRFDWTPVTGAFQYEIRLGASWAAGSQVLQTTTNVAVISPILVGTHHYWIKALTSTGIYSINATERVVTVPAIAAPVLSAQIIDNFVLLSWTEPSSTFEIDYYNLYRDSVLIGWSSSNFTTIFEAIGGTFIYSVEAVDLAGNVSSLGTQTVLVSDPVDYEIQDTHVSDFSGTKVNTIIVGDKLLCCINLTETWAEHFVDNSWDQISDQIAAGYPIYCQPTLLTGSYQEVIDYVVTFGSILCHLDWSVLELSPSVAIAAQIEFSTDGITYDPPISGQVAYGQNVRFVRVTLTFTPTDDDALIRLSNFRIMIDVKTQMDSGQIEALATDAGGTIVNFNKAFKDVDATSITLIANSLEPIYPVYQFEDVPNPTHFHVLIFDSAGQRITKTISWKARGIV
jgi:hypothetical protein